jgi:hypothetical protein
VGWPSFDSRQQCVSALNRSEPLWRLRSLTPRQCWVSALQRSKVPLDWQRPQTSGILNKLIHTNSMEHTPSMKCYRFVSWTSNSPHITEPERSWRCLPKTATCPHPQTIQPTPHSHHISLRFISVSTMPQHSEAKHGPLHRVSGLGKVCTCACTSRTSVRNAILTLCSTHKMSWLR